MYINSVKIYNNNNIMDLRSISFHFQFDENVLLFFEFLVKCYCNTLPVVAHNI